MLLSNDIYGITFVINLIPLKRILHYKNRMKNYNIVDPKIYYEGIHSEYNVVTWERKLWANTSAARVDVNTDGIIDYSHIVASGNHEGWYDHFIEGLLEEGYASRGEYYGVTSPELEGKTKAYEYGNEPVYKCDVKFIKFIEGVAHEVGYLKPKMPLDDVFKIQE